MVPSGETDLEDCRSESPNFGYHSELGNVQVPHKGGFPANTKGYVFACFNIIPCIWYS